MNACTQLPKDQPKNHVLTVAIASSLSDVMTEVKTKFNEQYPDIKIQFNQAASGVLAQQINQQAPIDVFASADVETIQKLVDQQKIQAEKVHIFAQNQLVLAQLKDSEIEIQSLEDLTHSAIRKVAMGNPKTVPAGKYAQNALQNINGKNLYQQLIDRQKIVFAENVRQILTYLENREVEAGFIYQTDLNQAPELKSIFVLDTKLTGEILYAIAPIMSSPNQGDAQSLIDFILSDQGETILQKYGFLTARD